MAFIVVEPTNYRDYVKPFIRLLTMDSLGNPWQRNHTSYDPDFYKVPFLSSGVAQPFNPESTV